MVRERNGDGWKVWETDVSGRLLLVHDNDVWACCKHPLLGVCLRRSVNLMKWKCHIPGKSGTDWAGGFFPLSVEFSEDYPTKPPKVTEGLSIPSHPTLSLLR
jgi:ubiquitin-protein ligase